MPRATSCCSASCASSPRPSGPAIPCSAIGGEEFVVIADDLTRAAALALGERIRRDVASHMEADAPLVTVSIGLATCADDASDYEDLFDCADRRLYWRNRPAAIAWSAKPASTPAHRSSPGPGRLGRHRLGQSKLGRDKISPPPASGWENKRRRPCLIRRRISSISIRKVSASRSPPIRTSRA